MGAPNLYMSRLLCSDDRHLAPASRASFGCRAALTAEWISQPRGIGRQDVTSFLPLHIPFLDLYGNEDGILKRFGVRVAIECGHRCNALHINDQSLNREKNLAMADTK